MSHLFTHPLPWYVAGPLIGLVVPSLLLLGNKPFGVSSNFRHLCAALAPCGIEFFAHDWKRLGGGKLPFLAGVFPRAVTASPVAPPLLVAGAPPTTPPPPPPPVPPLNRFAPPRGVARGPPL